MAADYVVTDRDVRIFATPSLQRSRRPLRGPERLRRSVHAHADWLGCHDSPSLSACSQRGNASWAETLINLTWVALQAARGDPGQPRGELVTEFRVGRAGGPHGRRVQLEGLHRSGGHGAEGPLLGGNSQDQPSSSPLPMDSILIRPCPGTCRSRNTWPDWIS